MYAGKTRDVSLNSITNCELKLAKIALASQQGKLAWLVKRKFENVRVLLCDEDGET